MGQGESKKIKDGGRGGGASDSRNKQITSKIKDNHTMVPRMQHPKYGNCNLIAHKICRRSFCV